MRNSDTPAFPVSDMFHANGEVDYLNNGLTKREFAIIKIMAAIASDPEVTAGGDAVSNIAIEWADALFRCLEKENSNE
jgi:hypothetical protein